jgi:hypothetical protein
VKQQETTPPVASGPGLDLVRLSQFLELSGSCSSPAGTEPRWPGRIAEGAALVLRVPGVAVGVLDDEGYERRARLRPRGQSRSA